MKKELADMKTRQWKLSSFWSWKKKKQKHEERWMSLMDLWETMKQTSTFTVKFPEGEDRKGKVSIWRKNGWDFPKFNKRHEYEHRRSSTNPKYIIIKLYLSTKRGSWKHQVKSGLSQTNHTSQKGLISRIHKEI